MNNKLDYLAQKEEELRKLNESLDRKKVDYSLDKPKVKFEESYERDEDFEDNQSDNPDAEYLGKEMILEDDEEEKELEQEAASYIRGGDSELKKVG
jgi:hypothetical protein